jgi:hypothetical protein
MATKDKTPVKDEVSGQKEQKLPEYKKEELVTLFDELIFSGEYKEERTIKGKLKVTFRTRSADEAMEISKALDSTEYKLLTTMQEQRAFLNLINALISYQGKDLSTMAPTDKAKYIKKLPVSIVGSLVDALTEFDRKVDLACREAEENF